MASKDSNAVTAMKDFVAGSIGGVAQCLSGHPLDTIKVRMQTRPDLYGNMLSCILKTFRDEGIFGFYKGVQSPLLGLTFMNAALFFSYGQSQALIRSHKDEVLSIEKIWLAGAMTGVSVAFVESPVDLFKSQLQANPKDYHGFLDCTRKIISKYGLRGVYQGFSGTQLRNIPGNANYFATYELVKRSMTKDGQAPSATVLLTAGGTAGVMYWLPIYPFDTIKSQLQTDSINPAERKFKGWLDCSVKVMKSGGITALYRGFVPCLLRSFPANATCFFAYETAKKFLH